VGRRARARPRAPSRGTRSVLYGAQPGRPLPRHRAAARGASRRPWAPRGRHRGASSKARSAGCRSARTIEGPQALQHQRFAIRKTRAATLEHLEAILVPAGRRGRPRLSCPWGELADVHITSGPPMVRDEAGLLVGYVYVDIDSGDARYSRGATSRKPRPSSIAPGRRWRAPRSRRGPTSSGRGSTNSSAPDGRAHEARRAPHDLHRRRAAVPAVQEHLQGPHRAAVRSLRASSGASGSCGSSTIGVSTAVWVGVIALVGLAAQTGDRHDRVRRSGLRAPPRCGADPRPSTTSSPPTWRGRCSAVRPKAHDRGDHAHRALVPLLWATTAGPPTS